MVSKDRRMLIQPGNWSSELNSGSLVTENLYNGVRANLDGELDINRSLSCILREVKSKGGVKHPKITSGRKYSDVCCSEEMKIMSDMKPIYASNKVQFDFNSGVNDAMD